VVLSKGYRKGYAKELLFAAVVKSYGLRGAEALFVELGMEEHAALAKALQGTFPALLVKGGRVVELEEVRATYDELWVEEGPQLRLTLPLVRPFLSFTGFIYLSLPEALHPLGRMIEDELRLRV